MGWLCAECGGRCDVQYRCVDSGVGLIQADAAGHSAWLSPRQVQLHRRAQGVYAARIYAALEQVFCQVKRSDVFTVVLVTVVTLFSDLAIAVIIGMVFQSIMHAWEMGNRGLSVTRTDSTDDQGKPVKVYIIEGSLFFASVSSFLEFFDLENDPDTIKVCLSCP